MCLFLPISGSTMTSPPPPAPPAAAAAAAAKSAGDEACNLRCINAAPVLVALLGGALEAAASTETIDVGVDVRETTGVGVVAGLLFSGRCCGWAGME